MGKSELADFYFPVFPHFFDFFEKKLRLVTVYSSFSVTLIIRDVTSLAVPHTSSW